MTITATLTDTAVGADFSVSATITFTDGTGYSASEVISADPTLNQAQLSNLVKLACAKHAALAAKRTASNTLTNSGASKPYSAFIGQAVATFP